MKNGKKIEVKKVDKFHITYKTYLKAIILLFIYPIKELLYFLPRNNKIWLFGADVGKRYADNPKALFEFCSKNCPEIKTVWITKNKQIKEEVKKLGYDCYYAYEFLGIIYSAFSGVYIYCSTSSDINYWLSSGAFKVNLWHGSPLKKIVRDIDNPSDRDYQIKNAKLLHKLFYKLIFPGFFEKINIFVSPSDEISKRFESAWNLAPEQLHVTGYPRNDELFNRNELAEYTIKDKKINDFFRKNKKIITYLPTYRERSNVDFPIEPEKLNKYLKENEYLFVIKLHPFDNTNLSNWDYSNILVIESTIDIYKLLAITDILVTDYSSVVFDFLILKRPVIFFTYDLEEYIKNDRGMYQPFEEIIVGEVVKNTEELIISIDKNITNFTISERYLRIRKLYNQFCNPENCKRVYEMIKQRL